MFSKLKGGSKATRSCLPCLRLPSTLRCKRPRPRCGPGKRSLLSSMTSMSFRRLTAPTRSIPPCAFSLRGHACIELNQGKTRIWNAAGEEPRHLPELQPADSNDRVWVGDWTLPPSAQGLQVLGTPIGSAQYVQHALTEVRTKQDLLLHRIPWVENLQAAWLLLLFCAAPRSNYLLRVLPPADTSDFAAAHDAAVAHCVSTLVAAGAALTDLQLRRAQLPLRLGGCGLRSAHRSRLAAYWASWADTLPILHSRLPLVADRLLQLLSGEARPQPPSILAASQAAQLLRNSGATVPPWESIIGGRHTFSHEDRTPGDFLRGWQRDISAAQDLDELAALLSDLSPPKRALLLSQAGPQQRPRSHNPSYQPGIPARQPAFPHLAATAAPSPLELRPFPVSVWLGTRPLRRPPCRMRHHWRPPGTSCTHRTRGRPHLPRGRCPRRGQRAALAHEPRGPGHRRTPDRSPRKRLAALARGSAGSRRDPRQPPWAAPDRCATLPTRTRARRSWQPPSASGNTPTPSFPARAAAT